MTCCSSGSRLWPSSLLEDPRLLPGWHMFPQKDLLQTCKPHSAKLLIPTVILNTIIQTPHQLSLYRTGAPELMDPSSQKKSQMCPLKVDSECLQNVIVGHLISDIWQYLLPLEDAYYAFIETLITVQLAVTYRITFCLAMWSNLI